MNQENEDDEAVLEALEDAQEELEFSEDTLDMSLYDDLWDADLDLDELDDETAYGNNGDDR